MSKKIVLVVSVIVGLVFVMPTFAAQDLSKYQYFTIDRKSMDNYAGLGEIEVDITEGFESLGLKYVSEKQIKDLNAKEQENILILRFAMTAQALTINLIDYTTERNVGKCTGKTGMGGVSMSAIYKTQAKNAIKDAKKVFGKK